MEDTFESTDPIDYLDVADGRTSTLIGSVLSPSRHGTDPINLNLERQVTNNLTLDNRIGHAKISMRDTRLRDGQQFTAWHGLSRPAHDRRTWRSSGSAAVQHVGESSESTNGIEEPGGAL